MSTDRILLGHDNGVGAVVVIDVDLDTMQGTESAILEPSDPTGIDRFGHAVSLRGDTALIGAPRHEAIGAQPGATYVFQYDRVADVWNEEQKIIIDDPTMTGRFGFEVLVTDDFLAVGTGTSLYIFRFDTDSNSWVETQKVEPTTPVGGGFANKIAYDGTSLLVGSTNEGHGYVYHYTQDATTGLFGELEVIESPATGVTYFDFGVRLALDDGRLAIVAPQRGGDDFDVILYQRSVVDQTFEFRTTLSTLRQTLGLVNPVALAPNAVVIGFGGSECAVYRQEDPMASYHYSHSLIHRDFVHTGGIGYHLETVDGVVFTASEDVGSDGFGYVAAYDLKGDDCNCDGTADACTPDCNQNFIADDCDLASSFSEDCNVNNIPDECEWPCLIPGTCSVDCNCNGSADELDIQSRASRDCDDNGIPDECQIYQFSEIVDGDYYCRADCDPDCNSNGIPDACELSGNDCDLDGRPDDCGIPVPCEFDPTQTITPFPSYRTGFGEEMVAWGDRLFISAPTDSSLAPYAGSVYVARYYEATKYWVVEQILQAPGVPPYGYFGYVTAASEEFFFASRSGPGLYKTRTYVFRLDPASQVWQPAGILYDPDNEYLVSVPIAAMGNQVFSYSEIGDFREILVHRWDDVLQTWIIEQVLDETPHGSGKWGFSIDAHGDTLAIGAEHDQLERGSVLVYHYDEGMRKWVFWQTLQASDGVAGESFGTQVAVDDGVMVVGSGGKLEAGGLSREGSAYIFRRNPITRLWSEEQKLEVDSLRLSSSFPRSVAIDGDTVVAGEISPGDVFDPQPSGVAIFRFDHGLRSWLLSRELFFDSLQSGAGTSVELVSGYAVYGAPNYDLGIADVGLVAFQRLNDFDCDCNDSADVCDLLDGQADCQGNGILDACETDCNGNGAADECDLADGTSEDCDQNDVPDECESDVDLDGIIDTCDVCPLEFTNDEDGDAVCYPADQCPTDPEKLQPGQCGCGVPDLDSDLDTIPDCLDQCDGQDDLADVNNDDVPDCLQPPGIPTVSFWGMAILALIMVVANRCVVGTTRAE